MRRASASLIGFIALACGKTTGDSPNELRAELAVEPIDTPVRAVYSSTATPDGARIITAGKASCPAEGYKVHAERTGRRTAKVTIMQRAKPSSMTGCYGHGVITIRDLEKGLWTLTVVGFEGEREISVDVGSSR